MGEIILQAKNIDKSFSNGKTKLSVLKNFSLDVEVGQIITIMGQSGSGKTTALNILGTLDQADSGELTINGVQVHDMNETELSTIADNNDIGQGKLQADLANLVAVIKIASPMIYLSAYNWGKNAFGSSSVPFYLYAGYFIFSGVLYLSESKYHGKTKGS